jgi:glycosyltransferase involved in cell wall biosynthesis
MSQPLVSGLMVTKNRIRLARRAISCFAKQTWENKELVIIDDGKQDYTPILEPYRDRFLIQYHRVEPMPGKLYLGGLRNISLERATGDYCMQWDDDEWYHPDRITAQMRLIEEGQDVCVLKYTLMHLDSPEFVDHIYRASLGKGTPGTIIHKRSTARYPNTPKEEDSVYLQSLSRKASVGVMGPESSYLFIRCFHGENTWDREHFLRRLRRTIADRFHYLNATFIRRDIFSHPAFQLTQQEVASARLFLQESREFGLLCT